MLHRVESLQFDARIRRAELPVDRADPLVAMVLPALNLLAEVLDGGNVVGQALPGQHTQFDLSNIEPAGVLGGVMDLQSIRESFGLFRRQHLVERGGRVGIEVVHHQDDFLSFGIVLFEKFLHEERPVLLGAVFGHFQVALANEWFIGNEQIGTALLLIAVVLPCDLSRLG